MRNYIDTGNITEVIKIMSEGSEEAEKIIKDMIKPAGNQWESLKLLLTADDMNIRGGQFVTAFTVYFANDMDRLREAIQNRDTNLITFLNSAITSVECRAVSSGAYRFGKHELQNPEQIIYIVDHAWQVLYQIPSGTKIRLVDLANRTRDIQLHYLDDYHFDIGGRIWEVHEFGMMLLNRKLTCYPITNEKLIRFRNLIYQPPKTQKEKKQMSKRIATTSFAYTNRVGKEG